MKKIIFLLLISVASYGQAVFDEGIQNTAASTLTPISHVVTQDATGLQGKALPDNLPVGSTFTNISPSTPTIGGVFAGIDSKLGAAQTTAGQTARVNFTGDNVTINSVDYFLSSTTGKGTATAGLPASLSLGDNVKSFFLKDVISILQPSLVQYPAGTYAGQLTVSATPTPNATQQRFTVEIYKTNNLGIAIASGVAGAPIGSLGVAVITILDSGIINLTAGAISNISVSGQLLAQLTINPNERIKYRVSAQKVGTGGGNVTMQVYYGSNYNSYYDVPIPITTDAVLNRSTVVAVNTTDALSALNTNKENLSNKQNSLAIDISNTKYPTVTAVNSALSLKSNSLNPTFTGDLSLGANLNGSTTNKLKQIVGATDYWSIYGSSATEDRSELVFEVGDNGESYSGIGERFRFSYTNIGGGSAKDVAIIDYDKTNINASLSVGSLSAPTARLNLFGGLGGVVGSGMTAIKMTDSDTGDYASISSGIVGVSNSGMEMSINGISRATFSGTGVFNVNNLSGTGTRTVVADASGNLSATDIAPTSGTYTPTLTNVANASSSSFARSSYTKIGNAVTVSFSISITPSATGTVSLNMSLPFNRTTTNTANFGAGTAVNANVLLPVSIQSTTVSDVKLAFIASNTNSSFIEGIFQYLTTE